MGMIVFYFFINEVPVCYLPFRKDSLFCRKQTEQLMKILHTADWHLGQTFMNTTAGKSISIF